MVSEKHYILVSNLIRIRQIVELLEYLHIDEINWTSSDREEFLKRFGWIESSLEEEVTGQKVK